MAETINRATLALTNDTITNANCLAYTATTYATAYVNIANIHATNDISVDVAVDVLGAGTTVRYLMKTVTVPVGSSIVLPAITLLNTDKLRIRASASSSAEAYVSIIETT